MDCYEGCDFNGVDVDGYDQDYDFSGTYSTANTRFYLQKVPNSEREFIDFEAEDEQGNAIITFGLSEYDDTACLLLTEVAEYFHANIRTPLNIYIATLEFMKLFSAESGTFCPYEAVKNPFLFQIFVHVACSNPLYALYCSDRHMLRVGSSEQMRLTSLMDKYDDKFVRSVDNLKFYI